MPQGLLIQCQIGFSIDARGQYVQILKAGRHAPNHAIADKFVVRECLMELANNGYNFPTLSSMKVQALNEGGNPYDVRELCAMLARTFPFCI